MSYPFRSEEERGEHRHYMDDKLPGQPDYKPCYPVKDEYPNRGLGLIFWALFFAFLAYLVCKG
jgi:hypothetical protein